MHKIYSKRKNIIANMTKWPVAMIFKIGYFTIENIILIWKLSDQNANVTLFMFQDKSSSQPIFFMIIEKSINSSKSDFSFGCFDID